VPLLLSTMNPDPILPVVSEEELAVVGGWNRMEDEWWWGLDGAMVEV